MTRCNLGSASKLVHATYGILIITLAARQFRPSDSKHAVQSTYTCETNTSAAFDSDGKACIDINELASSKFIRAAVTANSSYVYCGIPKNGCTVHFGVMQRLTGVNDKYERSGFVHSKSLKDEWEIAPAKLSRMMLDPNIQKYMVVRNPMQRVLSGYLNKVERSLPRGNLSAAAVFKKWVYRELKPGMDPQSLNSHWRPQVNFCGIMMRDFWKHFRVFRVEKPAEYVDFLEKLLPESVTKDGWNGKENLSLRESVLGPRIRTEGTNDKFFMYVRSLDFFDYLAEVYKADIKTLGYGREVADMRAELAEMVQTGEISDVDSGRRET